MQRLRVEAGLTQIQLAERLDKPQSFVSKIETGERTLYAYELFDYADALGLASVELANALEMSLKRKPL